MYYESYYGVVFLDTALSHHGIKGQKWGVTNGPPYPLDEDDHSSRENRLRWRTSLNKKKDNERQRKTVGHTIKEQRANSFQLSDRQKTALKIGAAVAVAGLATYGAYKLSQTETGNGIKSLVSRLELNKPVGKMGNAVAKIKDTINTKLNGEQFKDISGTETVIERMTKTNPEGHHDNCLPSAIAGQARLMGKDVYAQELNSGNTMMMHRAIRKCFKNAEVYIDSSANHEMAKKFAKSKEDAAELLRSKFGDNASGIVGVNWTQEMGGGGHAFNFQILNGHVIFNDYQEGYTDSSKMIKLFWSMNCIDPNKYICIARCDNASLGKTMQKFVRSAA